MGKSKQQQQKESTATGKEKKFDRNVEISAPILDPEIIKAIHTPPKNQRIDPKQCGFKALLTDLNSQDSTDEPVPIVDHHVPSYIGISCAVSGYSGYSSYAKRAEHEPRSTSKELSIDRASSRSRVRAMSPITHKIVPSINHVTIDRTHVQSDDQERKELTEKLTASATERYRSPSPCIPPTEDDRHHGAYVGARYCPLPPPSNIVNKHIPLLGIDDDQNPDDVMDSKENKVEQKIASLYGEEYVENWRESIAHKKELLNESHNHSQQSDRNQMTPTKNPKDLVILKPTPLKQPQKEREEASRVEEVQEQQPQVPQQPKQHQQDPQLGERLDKKEEQHDKPVLEQTTFTTPVDDHKTQDTDLLVDAQESPDNDVKSEENNLPVTSSELLTPEPQEESASPDFILKPIDTHPEASIVQSIGQSPSPLANANDGHYYMGLLEKETSLIEEQSKLASEMLERQEAELDEEQLGNLRSAIGKANLLVSKKFKQFKELCEANINAKENEQFATLNDDLAGFWDMLSIQVNDVHKLFDDLLPIKTPSHFFN